MLSHFMQIASFMQFAWNVKTYFLRKIKKIISLLSAEYAQSDKG